MKALVQDFTNQLRDAKIIADKAIVSPSSQIKNIVVTGLGGSGIGGTIISELVADTCSVPIVVNKDYFLPAFVDESTLLIVSSYSGNTEETLHALEQAIVKKAQIIAVCSGGKVVQLAKQHQFDFIEVPGGKPPRSAIAYSLVQLMKILTEKGLAEQKLFEDLDAAILLLDQNNETIQSESKKIAEKLFNKIPVLYSLGTCEGTVVRFRQQINENSKMLCWHHTFPEMNHNELVGWTQKNNDLVVVTFHTSFDFNRTKKRYEFCRPIFEKYSSEVIDIHAKGSSKLEQFLYLINLGDWISCELADLKGIDPVEVNVINELKEELSKF
jgi:glucose/mannose-6-phosphate isomerase